MCLPGLLIGVPFVAAILAFCLRGNGARNILVKLAAAVTMVLSVGTAIRYFGHPAFLKITGGFLPAVLLAVDVIAAAVIFYYTLIKFKKFKIAFLELIQLAGILWFEKGIGHAIEARHDLLIDNFALIMVLIAGIIGSLIAVFSLGYMEEFQKEHRDVQDRRPFFFFVIFLFLSAMFGLVISNNLLIMYTCWEITSLCSFLLIGYTQTEEAVENSFKALWMNLLGGVAFAAAILWLGAEYESVELSMLINLGRSSQPVEIAVALLVFCGFTKAAMMPFSGWLLGAMVAPTPTSALLHSSTMVKAGVFLIIKLCPVLGPNHAGLMTMFIGGATFLFASFVAISQSDGKKVLAYSTISNLGLIVCCAGIGSYEAAWTAIMIVVFHAVAKSLMFLSVGTAEQQLGSRNIENFDGMFCSLHLRHVPGAVRHADLQMGRHESLCGCGTSAVITGPRVWFFHHLVLLDQVAGQNYGVHSRREKPGRRDPRCRVAGITYVKRPDHCDLRTVPGYFPDGGHSISGSYL